MRNINHKNYVRWKGSDLKVDSYKERQKRFGVRSIDVRRVKGITMNLLIVLFTLSVFIGCAGTDREKIQTIFYPMPPQTPKIQFLTSITKEDDVGKKRDAFKEFLIGKSQVLKEIARPFGMSSEKGKIYVSDRTYKKILIIDLENKEFDYIRTEKTSALDESKRDD